MNPALREELPVFIFVFLQPAAAGDGKPVPELSFRHPEPGFGLLFYQSPGVPPAGRDPLRATFRHASGVSPKVRDTLSQDKRLAFHSRNAARGAGETGLSNALQKNFCPLQVVGLRRGPPRNFSALTFSVIARSFFGILQQDMKTSACIALLPATSPLPTPMDTSSQSASHISALNSAKVKLSRSTRIVRQTLISLAIAVAGSSHSQAQNWTPATPHPILIDNYAFAQDGEEFYVISGYNAGFISRNVRRYNPTTNAWSGSGALADIPFGSYGPASAFFGGKIYVAHGGLFASDQGDHFQIYNVATNLWSAGAPRPGGLQRRNAAAGAFNGKFYLAGGSGSESTLSVYDIASNSWSAGPGLPQAYRSGGYAQIGQFLYLIGGITGSSGVYSTASMRFNMATNTWSIGPAFTPQRAAFALAAAGTRLFAIGGVPNGSRASAQVDELETSTWPAGSWAPSPNNLPAPRRDHSAGFFSTGRAGGEIWITGGLVETGSNLVASNDHLFRPVSIPCQNYNVTQSTRALVPATTDIGNHCNNCTTAITFPFPISFYGTTYTSANVSSNGNLQFAGANASGANTSLPAVGFNATIFAFFDNVVTSGAGDGIFTAVTGAAPNRVFTIEWRVSQSGVGTTNFEIRFSEGSSDFEVIYGATTGTFAGTIGVQGNASGLFTQFAGPNANVPPAGTRLLFTTACCAPIAFTGAIGTNSSGYPGTSGMQAGRVTRSGAATASVCGTPKTYPGTFDTTPRAYDAYTFVNNGPATCVTFSVNTGCTAGAVQVFPVAYLGSFNPANIAQNYLGDPGSSPIPFGSFSVNVPANATVVLVVSEVTAGGACPSYDVVVRGLSCPLELMGVTSRKRHSFPGEFEIPLPLTGEPGVECRVGQPASGNHNLVFTFNSAVTSGTATVTSGIGTAGSPTFLGTRMIVPLSGVTDIQKVTVTSSGVTSSIGQVLPNFAVSMNVLLGDTTGNKSVNASDVGQTKGNSGLPVNAGTFRTDTTVSGVINASDISQVKANSGQMLPP